MSDDTFPAPRAGWNCFHCGEHFSSRTDEGVAAARDHFGETPIETPACKLNALEGGLLKLYREAQNELRSYREEDNASYREFYRLGGDHSRALMREEEKGYARGLADGRAIANDATEALSLINVLRGPEGHAVTLLCDNPDFNGQPNCAIEVTGDWTGWAPRRFTGDTVLLALRAAAAKATS